MSDARPRRLAALADGLTAAHVDGLLITSLPNIRYLTGFSGFSTEDRDAFLLITKNHQYIFTHGIYKEAAEKEINADKRPEERDNPGVFASHQNSKDKAQDKVSGL